MATTYQKFTYLLSMSQNDTSRSHQVFSARCFVLVDNVVMCYVLPVLWMKPGLPIIGQKMAMRVRPGRLVLKLTQSQADS